jgi:hypothetical protein
MQDTLVEARQSVRLCDALAGRELLAVDDEVEALTTLRERIDCGGDSEVQLIQEGQHALDVCFADSLSPADLCPSGSAESREQVALAIRDAVAFAGLHAEINGTGNGGGDQNSGNGDSADSADKNSGSLSFWFLFLVGSMAAVRYKS